MPTVTLRVRNVVRFNCTAEEAKELREALKYAAVFSNRLELQSLLTRERYMVAYQKYRGEYQGARGTEGLKPFFKDLKENYPRIAEYDGNYFEPITRTSLVVHMLELPLSEVPLYLTSADEQVRILSKWRLKKGR